MKAHQHGPVGPERRAWTPAQWDPSMVPSAQQIAWWRELYTNDGAGRVNPWIDIWVGNDMGQATALNRPAITDPDAVFNNLPSFLGNGTTTVLIAPVGTEPNFVAMSNGTGVFIHLIWQAIAFAVPIGETYLFGTAAGTAEVGTQLRWNDTLNKLRLICSNGVTTVFDIMTANGTILPGVHRTCLWIKDGLGPQNEFELWDNGVLLAWGTVPSTFSAANPTRRPVMFRSPASATLQFAGKLNETMVCTDVGLVQRSIAYMQRRVP